MAVSWQHLQLGSCCSGGSQDLEAAGFGAAGRLVRIAAAGHTHRTVRAVRRVGGVDRGNARRLTGHHGWRSGRKRRQYSTGLIAAPRSRDAVGGFPHQTVAIVTGIKTDPMMMVVVVIIS